MQVAHTSTGSVALCDISSQILKDLPDLKTQHRKSETYFQTGGGSSLRRWVDALVCHAAVVLPRRSHTSAFADLLHDKGLTQTPKIRFVKLGVDSASTCAKVVLYMMQYNLKDPAQNSSVDLIRVVTSNT